ncbi:DUF3024 domain-containing protein [Candidatus Sulfidibacterium hydrothermale]|uniref:DUF3024 domain-containing protein n=1 Tax=Candidatus Sulfidibacterium hydrothermale TaxID=2875962 RepID=UPI001F0ADC4A|nr:DUF3024 domain-containing protein [Candidatus Sulfidibacterium hydrothermale]UBM61326.1 DUF3024 domain-containing protein [Candidatus Sulfidibacterium hydrothermale]
MTKATIDINESKIKQYVEPLRSENQEIRTQLDFGYSYDGKIVEIYEIRPLWNNPAETQNIPFVKIRFYKSKQLWNLYWMRASGKWELYKPFSKSTCIDKIIGVIREDKHGCFFG